ncbi:hypothetical protein BV898_04598 [Hypsibius exemplaris]|uniref:Uncharacterized protein n=1 Tax=Hypsibius exemplaris TaxID=2072580 RepID=A0A1W0X1L9_HYPEX|nr:hypothetical protein BV898_04598 [Hypsibius exemplaris]
MFPLVLLLSWADAHYYGHAHGHGPYYNPHSGGGSDNGGSSGYAYNGCQTVPVPRNIRVFAIPDGFLYVAANASAGTPDSGFLVDLLNAIKQQSGIPYTLTSRPDLKFGNVNPDGTWDGTLIGALINDEADLIGADLTINAEREAVVDFLVPLATYSLQILYNAQKGLNNGVQYLIRDDADLTFLKISKNSTLQAIYRNILAGMPDSIVQSDTEGARKVLSGNFAYLTDSPFPQLAAAQTGGLLGVQPGTLGNFLISLPVQQGSLLREKLNIVLLELAENRFLPALFSKYGLVQFSTTN